MRLTHARFDHGFDARAAPAGVLTYSAIVLLLALIFWLDWITASAPLQHLYYVPIILASRQMGFRGGLGASLVAVLLYHLANPTLFTSGYRESDIVQIGLFITVGLVTARLSEDARRLHRLAATDDLTGLHNLRSFELRLAGFVRAWRIDGGPLSMLVLDVDRLKSLNEAHGHLAGAEAVRTVGYVLAARLPAVAVACRYGGDEFAVALPGYTSDEAHSVADDLRRSVGEVVPVLAGTNFSRGTLSISTGVACLDEGETLGVVPVDDTTAGEALFNAADRALYLAKTNGRNRVAVAGRIS